jgi:hypothetical protein
VHEERDYARENRRYAECGQVSEPRSLIERNGSDQLRDLYSARR